MPLPESDAGLAWAGPDVDAAKSLFTRLQFHSLVPRVASLAGYLTAPAGVRAAAAAVVIPASEDAPAPASADRAPALPLFGEPGEQAREPEKPEQPQELPLAEEAAQPAHTHGEMRVIASEQGLKEFAAEVRRAGKIAVYSGVEEITRDFLWPESIGVSAGNGPCLVRLDGDRSANQEVLWRSLQPILVDPGVAKVGFDLKWVFTLCFKRGVTPTGTLFDILIATYLLDPTRTLPAGRSGQEVYRSRDPRVAGGEGEGGQSRGERRRRRR